MYFSIKASLLKLVNALHQASPMVIISLIPGGGIFILNQYFLENQNSLITSAYNGGENTSNQQHMHLHALAFTTPQQSINPRQPTDSKIPDDTANPNHANYHHLNSLQPKFSKQVRNILSTLNANGLKFVILESYRSTQRQSQLYEIGRRGIANESVVTHAQAGQSMHEKGLAVDLAPIINGHISQNTNHPETLEAYQKLGKLAEEYKLVWGGAWALNDLGHIEEKH
jgi:LAS superfamily LD-carboxypeptidase LdcB